MLSLNDISFTANNRSILKSISCTIKSGDLVVIVGPNGAGKTTFFDMMSGRQHPTTGTIFLDNKNITSWKEQTRAPLIARLFQNPQFNSVATLTVAQNLALSAYKGHRTTLRNGMNKFPQSVYTQLKKLNLHHDTILNSPMEQLSGGQRQLIAFIMATIVPPQLLLLDEPTAALDPSSATNLLLYALDYIQEHHITTVIITHDPQLALSLGTTIWVLEHGHITREFSKEMIPTISAVDLVGHINYGALAMKR